MGVYIYLGISKAVTKEEWRKTYEETLPLVKAFSLAEIRKVPCMGIDVACLVPTTEREERYGRNKEKRRAGWNAIGDYRTRRVAEDYYLPRDLIQEHKINPDAGDALMGILPAYMDYDAKDPKFQIYHLWGGKTQGEPYHMYMLSIACLIEARLGEKAFVYGDITKGQCKRAVELANTYLNEPIAVPDRCHIERFHKRVSKLPLSEKDQLAVLNQFYLGVQDAAFGEYMRKAYSEAVCSAYWEETFEHATIGTIGFRDVIKEYLLYGFDLRALCDLVHYSNQDGEPQYETFINCVMDAKLHVKDKDCTDALAIDQDESQPYSAATLFAQFLFAGAKNKKVNRYIPIEEVRKALTQGLGDRCDVNQVIDNYLAREAEQAPIRITKEGVTPEQMKLACEQDPSAAFNQIMDIKKESLTKEYEEYDVVEFEDLLYYAKGHTLRPGISESLARSFQFYKSLLDEETYARLMQAPADSRCEWLAENNQYILIRNKDWGKIFTDITTNEASFGRYYPMVRVRLNSVQLVDMVTAIVLNDELYEYCEQMEITESEIPISTCRP